MLPKSPAEAALEALQKHERNAAFVDYATYDEDVAKIRADIVAEHVDKLLADVQANVEKALRTITDARTKIHG